MMLGVRDLERIQAAFPDLHMELVGGKVVVMSPSDILSAAVAVEFAAHLLPYVRERRLGTVAGAEGGYILPNGDLRALDVSFVSYKRLRSLPYEYARAVPELAVEVRSSSDRPREVLDKLKAFLEVGVLVGVYIDPRDHEVRIMRSTQADEVLGDADVMVIPDLFPGWELPVSRLWPPDAP
jgi:Uma2 family endonuclease